MNNDLCGVLNIYKEKGYTSHDVVAVTRKILNNVKAGHTGTLDPAAEGVLPICVGRATKIAELLTAEIKAYRAVVHLGLTTDTDDCTGKIRTRSSVEADEAAIREAVYSFRGEHMQTPPMYSAIKIDGQKLYELARKGVEVERKQRAVNIYELQVLNISAGEQFENDDSDFGRCTKVLLYVLCSKGTYIRSLCSDIGQKLGCGACMGELVRTRSGGFSVEESIKLAELEKKVRAGELDSVLLPIDRVLEGLKKVYVKESADKFLSNGNKISINYLENRGGRLDMNEKIFVYDSHERLAGIYSVSADEDKKVIKPVTMLL